MATHEELKQEAIAAIDKLSGDTSVPGSTTVDDLEELSDQIAVLIQGIQDSGGDTDGGALDDGD